MLSRSVLLPLLVGGMLTTNRIASADAPAEGASLRPVDPKEAKAFVQRQQESLLKLLQQYGPASNPVSNAMDNLLDYDELTQRAFGSPCPTEVPKCDDLWSRLTPDQRKEVRSLLSQIIIKSYKKRLKDTLDYDVTYEDKVTMVGPEKRDAQIYTIAKQRTNPRSTASHVNYVVHRRADGSYKVVEIKPEGASLIRTYYDQFRVQLNNPAQGYPYLVSKLKDKLAKDK